MAPSRSLDFRPTDIKEKKIALLAVISFNDATTVPYSRGKLYEYFDINERTAQNWIAASTSSSSSQPDPRPETPTQSAGPQGIKRAHSEDTMAELLSSAARSGPRKPSSASRQNAGPKNGPGRKKAKVKDEVVTPSPTPPQQSLTPQRRHISQPRKRRQRESTEESFDFGVENSDEYVEA